MFQLGVGPPRPWESASSAREVGNPRPRLPGPGIEYLSARSRSVLTVSLCLMSCGGGLRVQLLRGQRSLPGSGHSEATLPHQAPGWDSDVFHLLPGRRVMPVDGSGLLLVSQARPEFQRLCLFSLEDGAGLQTSAASFAEPGSAAHAQTPGRAQASPWAVHSPGAWGWGGRKAAWKAGWRRCGPGCVCGSNSRSLLKAMLAGFYFPS